MAGPANNHILALLLVVVSHFILALANNPPTTSCSALCECEINLRLYAHQIADGPGVNQRIMISPPDDPAQFGQIAVNDWPVIVAPESTAAIVGRLKGIHVQTDRGSPTWFTSMSILFLDTRFGGSTIEVSGMLINDSECAIIGGTGQFATARGTIKFKQVKAVPQQSYKQLDIHAYYIPSDINSTGSAIKYYTELSSA